MVPFFLSNIFKGKHKNHEYALALDIGTEVVKALIFKIDDEEGKGIVEGTGKARQNPGDMAGGAVADITGVIETCEKAISIAENEAGVQPQQCIIGIAGELVKGATTNVCYERVKPKIKIDMPELKNIVQKIQWKAFDKIRQQLAWETGQSEIDVRLINASVVDVKIDGYRVTNPLEFQGKEVSISVFNAYAPMVHLGALQSIASELGLDLLSIVAEPYAVARCVGMEDAAEFSAIFIDVGGGTTDLAVVREGGIEGTKMFALGGRAFTKRIATELGLSFQEAERIKIKYSQNSVSLNIARRIEKILKSDCEVWLSGIELSLREFSSSDLLPSRILICGGGSKLLGIRRALEGRNWVKDLPFAKKPDISFIYPRDVVNIVDATNQLSNVEDVTPMSLANLALDIAGEEKVISSILRRAVRMIQN
ncbi:MAG: cell division FtsA domain-containing protein [Patescibacteria group bacterium]|nr:cell division FtsA domain-containing protein [Patescibacteria group bacterium]